MMDSLWAVIAAMVTVATPYAILIFHQYGKLIPMELDESAQRRRCVALADLPAHPPPAVLSTTW